MQDIFSEFEPVKSSLWKEQLQKDLKGITFDDLKVKDRNGIFINPFYTKDDEEDRQYTSQFTNGDWEITSEVIVKDAITANASALKELSGGASALRFVLLDDKIDLHALLKDIQVSIITVFFVVKKSPQNFLEQLQQYYATTNDNISEQNCYVIYDPIHEIMIGGVIDKDEAESNSISLIKDIRCKNAISVDGSLYNNAGCNSTYEIGLTLAHLNEYLNWAASNNSINSVGNIYINMATDTSFFEQIAKLRAMRMLHNLLFETYGINPEVHLQIQTSEIYRSRYDAYTNLLRDTIAGMAAVLGGCDSLVIFRFDKNVKNDTDFSNRMSRNQQLIFKEESYLQYVADAPNGSFYLETLTEQLAEKSWTIFKQIEAEGGWLSCFEKGSIQQEINAQAEELIADYKGGKKILVGVNKYINADDAPVATSPKNDEGADECIKAINLSQIIIG